MDEIMIAWHDGEKRPVPAQLVAKYEHLRTPSPGAAGGGR